MTSQAQLTHVANVEDDSTDEAFEVFRYVKVGGRRGTLFVEREVATTRSRSACGSGSTTPPCRQILAIRCAKWRRRSARSRRVCSVMRPKRGAARRQGLRYDLRDDRLRNSPAEDFAPASAQRSAAPRREARRRLGGMEKGSRSAVSLFRLGDHDPVGSLCRAGIEYRRAAVFRAKYLWVGEDRQERNRSRRLHCRRGRPRGGTAELGGDIGRGR